MSLNINDISEEMTFEENMVDGTVDDKDLDTEGYTPTYEEAFPPLDTGHVAPLPHSNPWNPKLSMRRTTVTQIFCIPVEERKFIDGEQTFGEKEQGKICQDIMSRTGVSIEMSSAKDKSLTVVITGKNDSVMYARKLLVQQLQTQARVGIHIPKEHHKYILGTKGSRLEQLELATATKVTIPRLEDNNDTITIVGTREGIEKAQHEIQLISDEQSKLAFERVNIPKIYHPFIAGPNQSYIKLLKEETGAEIRVPPPSIDRNEIIVSGEKEGVGKAVETIMKIYKEKERKCQVILVEVGKSQHKYIIGNRRSGTDEILEKYGVSVEVPNIEDMVETITLRGEHDKLGAALSAVYEKANSVVTDFIEAPTRLHKYIIGKKGAKINKITADVPNVHIEFKEGVDKITLDGPPADVEIAKANLELVVEELIKTMAFAEINVDQKYHKHIIGKQGGNVARLKEELGVTIRVPSDDTSVKIIRLEGPPEGVEKAKVELEEMISKMENEKVKDVIIEQRFHKAIIGAQGAKIKEIRDRFNQVQITFPEQSKSSDIVTLRGPKNDVDKCASYLNQMNNEMVTNNHVAQVRIFKDFHKNVIGKGGATIRKIRDDTDTKIDLPSESSDSDLITITGKKSNVEAARVQLENIQLTQGNITEVVVSIPSEFHSSMIGAKGRLMKSIMDECGNVIIRFPPEGSKSDTVTIRGPKDDVLKAKKQLLELASEKRETGFTAELKAKPEYHKFLIGRGGSKVKLLRENTGARVIFPSISDPPELQHLITIVGRQEAVEAAKKDLEEKIASLESTEEMTITVEPKHHRHFVSRRGEILKQIAEEFGGVSVSFPRMGTQSDKVVLKGAKDCVISAKERIHEIVAELDAQVSIECVIPQKYHRTVMGAKGAKVQAITVNNGVNIKFPERPTDDQNGYVEPSANGWGSEEPHEEEVETSPNKNDIIIISGRRENCDKAANDLLALVPITCEVLVPNEFHRYVIGQKGTEVRKMMDEYDVNISVPAAIKVSDTISVTGAAANVEKAEQALLAKVVELEKEKEDRHLRSFQLEVSVNPEYHPKIIGKKGAGISKIRLDHNVQIKFPDRGSDNQNIIIVTGLESDALAARNSILGIVGDLDGLITEPCKINHRVHSRIIGTRGRTVRKIGEEFKVDIKFPRDNDDPDTIFITGAEDNVLDCKDHLLNLEEEYMQDMTDYEGYTDPRSMRNGNDNTQITQAGFRVRDAPWSLASTTDFPDVRDANVAPAAVNGDARSNAAVVAPCWGPRK